MEKIEISAVSYTNTLPFIYGIEHSDIIEKIDLSLDIPADCARKLADGSVDIGLIPVAAVLDLPHWEVVTDYCIGANGPVNSVFIFSNCPVEEVKTIQLDPESRSSNALARVLIKDHWKIKPQFVSDAADYSNSNYRYTAFVQIGDRTFGKKEYYPYSYDLAESWKQFTGLPFVFAAWVANKPINQDFVEEFNAALKYGLANRDLIIKDQPAHPGFDVQDYLMNKLDFDLTPDKKEAMTLFLNYLKRF